MKLADKLNSMIKETVELESTRNYSSIGVLCLISGLDSVTYMLEEIARYGEEIAFSARNIDTSINDGIKEVVDIVLIGAEDDIGFKPTLEFSIAFITKGEKSDYDVAEMLFDNEDMLLLNIEQENLYVFSDRTF